jgi:hypothetical protein
MMDITKLIELLQNNRKVFHSEDDLKLSFGMEILNNCSACQVRLERPVNIEMVDWNSETLTARAPIDIVIIEKNGNLIPIELKYKTKKTEFEHDDEIYRLTEHGAVDIGRYSFRKDIFRIEHYLSSQPNSEIGYVLILTNDKAYFDTDVLKKDNYDKFLSFHDGAMINKKDKGWNYSKIDDDKYERRTGDERWWYKDKNKVHWTCTKELFYRLDLKENYTINWVAYSSLTETEFKYCLIKIEKK